MVVVGGRKFKRGFVLMSGLFKGSPNIEFYQLTQVGGQRLLSGTFKGMEVGEKLVLKKLGQLGGSAEYDELVSNLYMPSAVLTPALQALVNKGLVTPVGVQQPSEAGGGV
jgi:predicted transcriptional regulator